MLVMNIKEKSRLFLSLFAVLLLTTLTGCFEDDDSAAENAAEEISEGIEDAGEELDPNRTTGEKLGDSMEDAGEEIQDMAN